jgi:glycosyltransferase involved in cell wall biosynthesis
MKEGYIPRGERKKILLLSDDIRTHSGVGNMSKEIVLNTAHKYNWVNLGGAVKHPEKGKGFNISSDIDKITGITDSDVKVIASDGYGDATMLRAIIKQEKPDAIVHFTDPRYWIWMYQLENEIRQNIPLVFYTIWDDIPYPFYNKNFYRSDDMLLCISKQTKNIVENVLRDHKKEDWAVKYLPHGINSNNFFPITEGTDFAFEAFKKQILGEEEQDFVVLWNSRNIRRKNPSDIILAWRTFLEALPEEKAKKCTLVMHTEPIDGNGTDLVRVVENFCDPKKHRVVFSSKKLNEQHLNYLYNLSDAHMFMTDNEGWGLGLTESLTAGKMIIAPVQGGMQDQMRFEDEEGKWIDFSTEHPSNADGKYQKCGEWAIPIFPSTRSVKGSPLTPYIFSSQVSIEDASKALMRTYKMGKEERNRRGMEGRKWVMSDESMFTAENMGKNFIKNLDILFEKWKPQPRYHLVKVNEGTIPNNYNPDPISLSNEFKKELASYE